MSVPPETVGFLAVVLFLATLGDRLFSLIGRMRNVPEKREVSFSQEFASKTEFVELKRTVAEHEQYGAERRKAIYAMIDEHSKRSDEKMDAFRKEVKADVNEVHERVTDVLKAVAEVSGEIKHLAGKD